MARVRRSRAVVTGGNAGIGRATVLHLARQGWDVAFTYHAHGEEAATTAGQAQALGRTAQYVHADFARPEATRQAVTDLVAKLGGIDLLVNNAATNTRASLGVLTLELWRKTLDVNCTSALVAMQVAAEEMKARRGGCIINVTSVIASAPLEQGAAYCSSKAALRMLTQVAALELASYGIRVIDVAPGHTVTRMNFGDDWEFPATDLIPVAPMGRSAQPEEVAAVIAFLGSEQASYVSGTTVTVDGGLLLASGPETLQRHTGLPPST